MAASAAPFVTVIGSLGSAAAAVFVVYLFVGFMRESVKRLEMMYERLTMEFAALSKSKDEGIHQVAVIVEQNTRAIERLEEAIKRLAK